MPDKLTITELEALLYAAKLEELSQEKFHKVFTRALEVFEEEDIVVEWLFEGRTIFGNKSPHQLVLDGREDEVLRILGRIEHGIVS